VAPILFKKQASLEVFGEMKEVLAEEKDPEDRYLHVEYYTIISEGPGKPDSFTNVIPATVNRATLPDFRYLVLQHPEEATVIKARASTDAFCFSSVLEGS
jgi:hypothetical protein